MTPSTRFTAFFPMAGGTRCNRRVLVPGGPGRLGQAVGQAQALQ